MHPPRRQLLSIAAALCCAFGLPGMAAAQADYPNKPLRVIVPFPPGGASDTLGRMVAQHLSHAWGQPAMVENRPGAGGNIGAEAGAKAAPDGHTLTLAAAGFMAVNPSLYPKLNYDSANDFQPIGLLVRAPLLLVVNPTKVDAVTVRDFIQSAKRQPGKIAIGNGGTGTAQHLGGVSFALAADIDVAHVPYKGSAPALMDLVGGNLQVMFDAWASSGPFVKDGKTRLLAVTTAQRSKLLPDVPTVAESGLPGYEAMPWLGFVAPAGTPAAAVNRFHAELMEVLNEPEVQDKFRALGLDIIGNTPQQFADFIKRDIVKWAKVVKDSGAKAD